MVFMNEELRAELLRRVAVDQEARHALDVEAMAAADGENLPWLRQVITDVGWPGKSLVGEDSASKSGSRGKIQDWYCHGLTGFLARIRSRDVTDMGSLTRPRAVSSAASSGPVQRDSGTPRG
jgi:hypothetical protein